jgi:rhodanese-related sulfurtransferase
MKKFTFPLILLLVLVLTAVFAKAPSATDAVVHADVASFHKLWKNDFLKGTGGFQLIDIRTPEEYRSGHLKGAQLIDFYAADFYPKLEKLDKNQPVLIYCRSANRSGQAVMKMKQMGFKQVYNMKGGINAWIGAGYPVE